MSFLCLHCSLQLRRPLGPLLRRISEKYPGSTWQTETTSKTGATYPPGSPVNARRAWLDAAPRGSRGSPGPWGTAVLAAASPRTHGRARQVLPADPPGPGCSAGRSLGTLSPAGHRPGARELPATPEDTQRHTKGRDVQGDVRSTAAPPAPHTPAARAHSLDPGEPRLRPEVPAPRPRPWRPPKRTLWFKYKVGLVRRDILRLSSVLRGEDKRPRGSGRRRH